MRGQCGREKQDHRQEPKKIRESRRDQGTQSHAEKCGSNHLALRHKSQLNISECSLQGASLPEECNLNSIIHTSCSRRASYMPLPKQGNSLQASVPLNTLLCLEYPFFHASFNHFLIPQTPSSLTSHKENVLLNRQLPLYSIL